MKPAYLFVTAAVLSMGTLCATENPQFDTRWIPSQPQVLTYRTASDQGQGLYQVTLMKRDTLLEVYVNMITSGFTKTVSATMTLDMRPLQSTARIFVDGRVAMDTKTFYDGSGVRITTVMMPYNQAKTDRLTSNKPIVDFSQLPILPRVLNAANGDEHTFTSLDPRTNALTPLTIKAIGEGTVQGIECSKMEMNDFEGKSIYWIERGGRHRVILIEQPERHGRTELLQ